MHHLLLCELILFSEQIAIPLNVMCNSCLSILEQVVTKLKNVHRWIRKDGQR